MDNREQIPGTAERISIMSKHHIRTNLAEHNMSESAEHLSETAMLSELWSKFIWEGMCHHVRQFVAECELCPNKSAEEQVEEEDRYGVWQKVYPHLIGRLRILLIFFVALRCVSSVMGLSTPPKAM